MRQSSTNFFTFIACIGLAEFAFATSQSESFFKEIATLDEKVQSRFDQKPANQSTINAVSNLDNKPEEHTSSQAPAGPTEIKTTEPKAEPQVIAPPGPTIAPTLPPPPTPPKTPPAKPKPQAIKLKSKEFEDFKTAVNQQKIPYIQARKVYDYRNQKPSPSINKREYGPNNQHLPTALYQEKYTEYLFDAVDKSSIGDVRALLGRRANINARDVKNGYTPLMYAVQNHDEKIYKYLILKGADLNIQANDGKTALHIAVLSDDLNAMTTLIDSGIDYTILDKNNKRALQYSTTHSETIGMLIAKKADNSELIHFAELNAIGAVRYLLENGANPNMTNENGDTALMYAVLNNNPRMVSLLLKGGASPNMTNSECNDAFTIAKAYGYQHIYDILTTYQIKNELQASEAKPYDLEQPVEEHAPLGPTYDPAEYPSMGYLETHAQVSQKRCTPLIK
ncbi:hypothetical protein EDM53_00535 [Rickettsiales endosymbiont of Peranema trichophorum]|uniref:ankyrin repeat domain-containing protein n=1 Tax=Rickettsiales endosymbiont of Peranema trichophorum TaxID=2486577 RepID=UPI00102375C8|nr:ankyrin repeat domain-containing protein [Rickettsiales endosymbiont of Peranema trichophorum]RZI47706.1 hypothetical protein EDM53_00535 [Rickettsiales endosymbiont of Peranema trichophorum]